MTTIETKVADADVGANDDTRPAIVVTSGIGGSRQSASAIVERAERLFSEEHNMKAHGSSAPELASSPFPDEG